MSSKGKGKETGAGVAETASGSSSSATAATSSSGLASRLASLMANPATSSANPSESLRALWGYITPAIDHIMRSPTNNTDKAPAIDAAYHICIHTAVYNYFTNQSQITVEPSKPNGKNPETGKRGSAVSGADIYEKLDEYYEGVAREVLLGAPEDDSTLIHYLIPCFNRYSAGAQSVNRLLNYVNRHYVKRAVDEDKGWLKVKDVVETVRVNIKAGDNHDKILKKLKSERLNELKRWGYVEDGSQESLFQAEACAEAASLPDRVVPLSSLAYRAFRIQVLEPLLAVPKKKKGKVKRPPSILNGEKPPGLQTGPKGRLARAVKELLESKGGDEEERRKLAEGLSRCLRTAGVKPDHVLRKKLDKFLDPES